MSLRQLGEAIGVSRPTVYAYAAGTLQASPERLEAIARVTGVGLEFFEVSDLPLIDGDSVTLVEALLSPPNPDQAVEVATAALTSGLEKEPSRLARLSFQAGNALLQKGRYVAASQHLRDAAADFERSGNRRGVPKGCGREPPVARLLPHEPRRAVRSRQVFSKRAQGRRP